MALLPMATFLRPLSYRYQWLYDAISRTAALAVGGERRFRHLALEGIVITSEMEVFGFVLRQRTNYSIPGELFQPCYRFRCVASLAQTSRTKRTQSQFC